MHHSFSAPSLARVFLFIYACLKNTVLQITPEGVGRLITYHHQTLPNSAFRIIKYYLRGGLGRILSYHVIVSRIQCMERESTPV